MKKIVTELRQLTNHFEPDTAVAEINLEKLVQSILYFKP